MRFIGVIFFLFIASFPAQAELVVASGGRLTLISTGAFDQACHSLGRMSVSLIQQPSNGTILVEDVKDYPNFWAFNTRSRCNTLKLPKTRVSYQSNPGYVGTDETIIEIIGPMGRVRRLRYYISVRQGLSMPSDKAVYRKARR